MQPTNQRQAKVKLMSIVVAILVIAGIILVIDHLKTKNAGTAAPLSQATGSNTTPQTATGVTGPASNENGSAGTSDSSYKDGTYTASSQYYVPHGSENIQVTLTLKNGVIADSSITNSEGNSDSASYQEDFAAVYKSYVVGKNVNGFKIGVIAGASDTVQGFNDALSQIAVKAQA